MTILGGIFMAVGGLGVFAAGPPLAFLSERFGWRSALVAVALFSVLMAVVDRLVIRDRPAAVPAAQPATPPRGRPIAPRCAWARPSARSWAPAGSGRWPPGAACPPG